MAYEMAEGRVPALPVNVRVGYVERSYWHPTDEEGNVTDVGQYFIETIEEGSWQKGKRQEHGENGFRSFWNHDVESICDVKDTPKFREWDNNVKEGGYPSLYWG
tara:strand:- start:101 stop:412 length:312 start_codon:yes stop_codon:yes gene_type:complete